MVSFEDRTSATRSWRSAALPSAAVAWDRGESREAGSRRRTECGITVVLWTAASGEDFAQCALMPPILAGLGWTKSTATRRQQAFEIHQRVDIFARRRSGCRSLSTAQLGEAAKCSGGPKRLLEPFEVNRLEIVCDGAGLGQCPGSVDVERQLDVGTGFVTCRADRLESSISAKR